MSHLNSSIRTIVFAVCLNIFVMLIFAIRDSFSVSDIENIAVAAIIHSIIIIPTTYIGCLIGGFIYALLGKLKDNTLFSLFIFGLLGLSLSLILYPFMNEEDILIYFLYSIMFVCSSIFYYICRRRKTAHPKQTDM
ncbi:hypothetical protein [Alteribacter aurantiacus]|uniref:hypothetical protein n=1 Tax=Alteribacter aurantiacus TaxID=254410 RepID=UPI00047EF20A|nr:hypothetical protein [Alteribacter aurantiacus]